MIVTLCSSYSDTIYKRKEAVKERKIYFTHQRYNDGKISNNISPHLKEVTLYKESMLPACFVPTSSCIPR